MYYNFIYESYSFFMFFLFQRYACQTIKVAPMKKLAGMSDMKEFKKLLDPIMKERVSGSEGNKQVQKVGQCQTYIISLIRLKIEQME